MVCNGEIPQRGVFPPEACIDPVPFIGKHEAGGLKVRDEIEYH